MYLLLVFRLFSRWFYVRSVFSKILFSCITECSVCSTAFEVVCLSPVSKAQFNEKQYCAVTAGSMVVHESEMFWWSER